MMKKTRLIASLLVMSAVTLLSSCLGESKNEYKISSSLPYFFNQIVDYADPASPVEYLYSDVSYTLEYNMTKLVMTINITGLTLPDGSKYPVLSFEEVPFKLNADGWVEASIKDTTPTGASGFVQIPVFKSFDLKICDRYITTSGSSDALYAPFADITYTIGDYAIRSLPLQLLEYPTTEVTGPDGSVYVPDTNSSTIIYLVNFDVTKHVVNIAIQGATFAAQMPAMNMRFSDIPFEIATDGAVHFTKSELIPSLITGSGTTQKDTPAPNYPITNLLGVYDPDKGFTISYTCTPHTSEGVAMGSFQVRAYSKYPSAADYE